MLTLWFSMKIVRSLMRTIGGEPEYAAQMARRIAKGDSSGTVTLKPGDKLSLLAAMNEMQEGFARWCSRLLSQRLNWRLLPSSFRVPHSK